MQLSVIILNYNVRHFLELCVLSVQKAIQNLDAEIIVVDNNSTDDSCVMMKQLFPKVKLIQNLENLGFPKGNNIGVAEAKGEYICILNPDTVVAEDTFEKILAFVEKQKNLGIIGCKLIDGTGNFLPESKRGIPTPWVAFTKIIGLYKVFPKSTYFNKYYAQYLNENETGKVDILVGAFMILKRDLYTEIGGFDENCFMYSDDIDLSYRVLQKEKSNYYFHETTVIHYKGESTIKDKLYMKRFREAMEFFYKKHFRVSLFFDFLMTVGTFFFTLFKKNQVVNIKRKIEQYVLISEDDIIKNKVENLLGNKVETIKIDDKKLIHSLLYNAVLNTEVLLDANSLSYKDCVDFMSNIKNSFVTFKIIPTNADYIIGSNSSNDRGEVIKF
ncbi:MAG TPA: glycosyltransferase family 2 protein [Flavobacterium sp.]|nr:glycosyltransferase family 2 protein [Flavobacterium sp.]